MTTVSRTVRRLVALLASASLLFVGAIPAHAATGFTVQGQVIFPEGYDPADAVHTYILLMPPTGNQWIRAAVSSDGSFSAKAPDTANYTMRFYDSSHTLYDGVVTADGSVTPGGPARTFSSDATITVTPRLSAVVSGRIVLPEGYDPATDGSFQIVAYRQSGSSWMGAGSMPWHLLADDGTFEYRGLDAGATYRFELRDMRNLFLTGYHGEGAFVETIEEARSVVAPGSGVVFAPPVASTISGRLTAPAGIDLRTLIADRDVQVGRSPAPSEYPEFPSYGRASVNADGTFTFGGLWPGKKFYVAAWAGSSVVERGMVDATGTLTLDTAGARTVTSGDHDVNISLRLPTRFSGTVELPEGFHYDPEAPPRVRPLPSKDEVYSLQWSSRAWVPVGPDGSFTTERAHSQTDFRLALTWPDGSVVYWTSNGTKPTADPAKATLVRPGSDVVFPSRNRLTNLSVPRVTGEARLGATLRADGGTWSVPSPTLRYQWLRDGKAVAGATRATYPLTTADVGSRLAVTVTASAPDFAPVEATSAQTAVVPKVRPALAVTVLKKGTTRKKVKLRVRIDAAGADAAPSGTLRVRYGKKTRTVSVGAKHRGVRTLTVHRTKRTGKVTATFTPSDGSSRYLHATTGTAKVVKVAPKVTVRAPKKVAKGKRARITVRVAAKALTSRPTGKITVTYGPKTRKVPLKAKHRGKVTVTLPRLTKGTYKVRVRYAPSGTWKKYLKAKSSTRSTLRAR